MRSTNNPLRDALHVFVLCAFALAQPLYDLLGRYATFFVAHEAEPADVLCFVLAVSLGLPALLVGLEAVVGLVSARLRWALHLALVAGLVALIVLPPLNRGAALPDGLVAALAALAGVLAALAYARIAALRSVCSVLGPAVLIFPALFLFVSPAANLVRPPTTAARPMVGITRPAPIVVVIFDELSLLALMNTRAEIDPLRFPNFAALARAATWYRNATAVADYTPLAVPAILTGLRPDHNRLPTAREHPDNLFTALAGSHRLQVVEPVTELCPRQLCPRPDGPAPSANRRAVLLADTIVLYLHMLAPSGLRAQLPDITRQWTFQFQRWFVAHLTGPTRADRPGAFAAFVDAIAPRPEPTLYFAHVLLPHYPYEYLPTGARYNAPPADFHRQRFDPTRPDAALGWAADNVDGAAQEQQRYLLQLALTDALLGRLIDRLRQVGLWDPALVVVTADHGVSFRPGESQRFVTDANHADIMWVPLFIKMPQQRQGGVDDRNVETIDILPSIADALGARIAWRVDGQSVLQPGATARPEKAIDTPVSPTNLLELKRLTFPAEPPSWPALLAQQSRLFGADTPAAALLARGPFPELIGRAAGGGAAAPFSVALTDAQLYDAVDPASGLVPSFVRGRLTPLAGAAGPPAVAVAVNGVIAATTQAFVADDRTLTFGVLLPDSAFRPGANDVEVFAVSRSGGQLEMRRVRSSGR
jgi:hypothetical protein